MSILTSIISLPDQHPEPAGSLSFPALSALEIPLISTKSAVTSLLSAVQQRQAFVEQAWKAGREAAGQERSVSALNSVRVAPVASEVSALQRLTIIWNDDLEVEIGRPVETEHTRVLRKLVREKSAWPSAMSFHDVLTETSNGARARGYAMKLNELAKEDCGLGDWIEVWLKPSEFNLSDQTMSMLTARL